MNEKDSIYIYNINNYELIKKIETDEMNIIKKFDENIIIGMNVCKESIDIAYDILDVNNIKYQLIKCDIIIKNFASTNILI